MPTTNSPGKDEGTKTPGANVPAKSPASKAAETEPTKPVVHESEPVVSLLDGKHRSEYDPRFPDE